MTTVSKTFSNVSDAGDTSAIFFLRDGQAATYTASGTIDAGCTVALQRKVGGAWEDVKRWKAGAVSVSTTLRASGGNQNFRFEAYVPLTDPATTLGSFAVSIADLVSTIQTVKNAADVAVLEINDEGIVTPKVTATNIAVTTVAATTVSATSAMSAPYVTAAAALSSTAGSPAAPIAMHLGGSAAEGFVAKVIDESISLVGNAALAIALTTPIPAKAVIRMVAANIQVAAIGGGTTVKVGVGIAADPDKYGLTSGLAKNDKITTTPTLAVLASQEDIGVYACATAGGAGDTALTVGTVRVMVVYDMPVALANA